MLLKHGIFTFGDTAREAYERMVEMVSLAEAYIARRRKPRSAPAPLPADLAAVADVAPILRGVCSEKDQKVEGAWRRLILDFRTSPAILDYVNGVELTRYAGQGVVTPDHTIRTKNIPLIVPAPAKGDLAGFDERRAGGGQFHHGLPRLFQAQYHAAGIRRKSRSTPCRV